MLSNLVNELTTDLLASGRKRTAAAYRSTLASFQKHMGGDVAPSDHLSPKLLQMYQSRLMIAGLAGNTVSFYMRMLRAIYNKGVKMGVCPDQPDLFLHVHTKTDPTPKRAVSPRIFGTLHQLDLSTNPRMALFRDLFLLSFCLQGISFIDLAYLRKTDLRHSVLIYRRAKTGSLVKVSVSDFALSIIQRLMKQSQDTVYLLPIIKNMEGNHRNQYQSALKSLNRYLKKLAIMANIEEYLTSYVARHTWATTARMEKVPIGIISTAMGHQMEQVTHVYFSDFTYMDLMMANNQVLYAAQLIQLEDVEKGRIDFKGKKNVHHLRSDGQKYSANI